MAIKYTCKTIRGHGRGKDLGFCTINCEIPANFPYAHGIYAGWVTIGETKHAAAIHYGPLPAFNDPQPSLEAHIINTELNERPDQIELELANYIRAIQNFSSPAALVKQISTDIEQIKKILQPKQLKSSQ